MNIFLKISMSDGLVTEFQQAALKFLEKEIPMPPDGEVINIDMDKLIESTGMSITMIAAIVSDWKK